MDPQLPNALEEERSGQIFGLTETPLGQIRRPKGCLYFEFVGAARRVRKESFGRAFSKARGVQGQRPCENGVSFLQSFFLCASGVKEKSVIIPSNNEKSVII